MPFNTKAYLDELVKAGAVSDEDRKVLEKYFKDDNAGLVKYLEENQLRQSEFSRLTDSMKQEKAALESEKANITKLQQQLASKEPGWTQEKQNLANKITAAETRLYQARQALMNKYDVGDDELKDIFGEAAVEPPKQRGQQMGSDGGNSNSNFDPSKYIDRDSFNSAAKSLIGYQNWLWKTQQQHHKLFGEHFDPDEILQAIEADPKLTPQQVWETKFNVSAKLKEIQEADIEKRANELAEKRYQEKMAAFSGQSLEGAIKPDSESFTSTFLKDEEEGKEASDYGAQPLSGDIAKKGLELWDSADA